MQVVRYAVMLVVGAITALAVGAPAASAEPAGLTDKVIYSGFSNATVLAWDSANRLIVGQQDGLVVRAATHKVVMDLRGDTKYCQDNGLKGLVHPPGMKRADGKDRWFALLDWDAKTAVHKDGSHTPVPSDTCGAETWGILAEVGPAPSGGPWHIERIIRRIGYSGYALTHTSGDLFYDATSGYLVFSYGDVSAYSIADQNAFAAQNDDSDNGKAMRVRPDGSGFQRIAKGLRNGFSMTKDQSSGDYWIGNTGWESWEDEERIPAAQIGRTVPNFGWPCEEGPLRPPAYWALPQAATWCFGKTFTPPAETYPHGAGTCRGPSGTPVGTCAAVTGVTVMPTSGRFSRGSLFVQDFGGLMWEVPHGTHGLRPWHQGVQGVRLVAHDGVLFYAARNALPATASDIRRIGP
jgi:hypothetical protein